MDQAIAHAPDQAAVRPTRYVLTSDRVGYDGGPGVDGLVHPDEESVRKAAEQSGRTWGGYTRYAEPTAFSAAAERTSFQLSYRRSAEPRVFHRNGLTGPRIDCAFDPDGFGAGDWEEPEAWARPTDPETEEPLEDPTTVDEWHAAFFAVAVAEAVHEACEWFKVDGRTVVNPHSPDLEAVCYDAAVTAARTMWAHAHHRAAPQADEPAPTLPADGLDGIRRRLASAERQTNGNRCMVHEDRMGSRKRTVVMVDDAHGSVLAEVMWDDGYAEFVANAPDDMAALLAEVERLRAELDGRPASDDGGPSTP